MTARQQSQRRRCCSALLNPAKQQGSRASMSIRALPYADRQRMYGGEASRQQARACNIVSSDAQKSRIAQRRVWEGRRVCRGREGEAGERRARMDGCTTPTSKSGLHVYVRTGRMSASGGAVLFHARLKFFRNAVSSHPRSSNELGLERGWRLMDSLIGCFGMCVKV